MLCIIELKLLLTMLCIFQAFLCFFYGRLNVLDEIICLRILAGLFPKPHDTRQARVLAIVCKEGSMQRSKTIVISAVVHVNAERAGVYVARKSNYLYVNVTS